VTRHFVEITVFGDEERKWSFNIQKSTDGWHVPVVFDPNSSYVEFINLRGRLFDSDKEALNTVWDLIMGAEAVRRIA
jgi:hypothetical protein